MKIGDRVKFPELRQGMVVEVIRTEFELLDNKRKVWRWRPQGEWLVMVTKKLPVESERPLPIIIPYLKKSGSAIMFLGPKGGICLVSCRGKKVPYEFKFKGWFTSQIITSNNQTK
ncbi:MAG: hypothetical protein V1712_02250 [Patescibacteria group bacterium]